MNHINRFCTYQGHLQFQVYHICTYKQCDKIRWCCSECLSEGIHRHSMPNQNHIMSQAKLSTKVQQEVEKLQKDFQNNQEVTQIINLLSQILEEARKLEKLIIELRQSIEIQLNSLIVEDDNLGQKSLIQLVDGQNFIQLVDEDINKLLNIENYQFNYNVKIELQDSLDKIQLQLNQIQSQVNNYQENKNNKTLDLKSRKYDLLKVYEGKSFYASSIISNDEQYLVFCDSNGFFRVYYIKLDKLVQKLLNTGILNSFQFTFDSQLLFAGCSKGIMYGFDVQNDFRIFRGYRIHQDSITRIITIQKQYLITCSDDKTIIKTDFINKIQIFKLVGHSSYIRSFDYDDQKDIIISMSIDKVIKIWKCANERVIINYQDNYNFYQLQLINDNQNILVLYNEGNLLKFQIDYQKKQLVKLNEYKDENKILGFYYANKDQNLLLIFKQYCKILNEEGKTTNIILHKLECEIFNLYQGKQLDNLNYIVLQGINKLYLAVAKN